MAQHSDPTSKRVDLRHPGLKLRAKRLVKARLRALMSGHRIWQVVADAVLVALAYWLAFFIRFDAGTPAFYQRTMFQTIGMVVLIKVFVFIATGMYDKWWRYLSVKDMEGVFRSVVLASVSALVYVYLVQPLGFVRIPRSVAVLDFSLTLFFVAGARFAARSWFERPDLMRSTRKLPGMRAGNRRLVHPDGTSVLVAGAGEAGRLIVREMQRTKLGLVPIGLIDDDVRKQHIRIDGVPVLGTTDDIPDVIAASRVDEVLIAMPSAAGETIQRVVAMCNEAGIRCRTLPGLHELVLSDLNTLTNQLREVRVEDILGREPITIDLQSVAAYLTDRTVLVTGAGGSIGSELSRQIAAVNPSRLVLVDNSEHNLFLIEQELRERGFDNFVPALADLNNDSRMRWLFDTYSPAVVFHAAAYKHVPMIEHNPTEAVRNNVFATRALCEIADEAGVERFVLVSTDKAVEPQTVMGQSKALAEWIVQAYASRSVTTRFMAVRFGNVLGSSGSVVPIFRRQIERGGPVTVTDERMTRFFMTIPEAVQLIIQAGAMGDGGEVFVLDMGKPVRIIELARNMIELCGKVPDVDIEISVVGIRPGEKLHEELFAGDEVIESTLHEKIWRARGSHAIAPSDLLSELDTLGDLVDSVSVEAMCTRLRSLMRPRIQAGAQQLPTMVPH